MTDSLPDLTDRTLFRDWTKVTIRYADLDPNGHVNNGAINQFFEDGRVGLRHRHMGDLPVGILSGFALVKFSATYRAPLHFPGCVEVGTLVTRIGRSSYELGQAIFQEDLCVATAEVVTVHLDRTSGRSSPLPDQVRAILRSLLTAPDEASARAASSGR